MSEFFNLKCLETKLKGKSVSSWVMFRRSYIAVSRATSTKTFTVSRQRTRSNFEHSIYLFLFRYVGREDRLMPGFALIVRSTEHGVVYPTGRRQHQQTAYVSAVHRVKERDAYFAIIPEDRRFQTVRWKTTYATRLKTIDNTVVNNLQCCSATK